MDIKLIKFANDTKLGVSVGRLLDGIRIQNYLDKKEKRLEEDRVHSVTPNAKLGA